MEPPHKEEGAGGREEEEESCCRVVRVGSRSSQLAMVQTHTIISALERILPASSGVRFEVHTMKTIGDKILDRPLQNIGQTNLFTKELEVALANNEVDMIVHSLKDLPTTLPPGMCISVIYKRDNPADALVLHPKHRGLKIDELPPGSVIGTSSLRRVAQLKRNCPNLVFKNVRGNLNTRLSKLDDGGMYDGLVLAAAGLHRLEMGERISQVLSKEVCMYAVGQGALAVETRSDDKEMRELLQPLNHLETVLCCSAERELLKVLGGGCSVPIGTLCCLEAEGGEGEDVGKGTLLLEAAVFSVDGTKVVRDSVSLPLPTEGLCSVERCVGLGSKAGGAMAGLLLDQGAGPLLSEAKEATVV